MEGNSDETQVTGGNWANRVLSKRSTGAGQAAGGRAANGHDDNDDAQIDSRRAGRSPGRRLNAPRPPRQPRGPRPSPADPAPAPWVSRGAVPVCPPRTSHLPYRGPVRTSPGTKALQSSLCPQRWPLARGQRTGMPRRPPQPHAESRPHRGAGRRTGREPLEAGREPGAGQGRRGPRPRPAALGVVTLPDL